MFTDALFCGVGLGFSVVDAAVAVSPTTVPFGVAQMTFTVSVNCAELPLVSAGAVQLTVPEPPTAGAEQVHPDGAANDWNVVAPGMLSVNVRLAASFGP